MVYGGSQGLCSSLNKQFCKICQQLSSLCYLFQPENLLVEAGAGVIGIKLVDFGDARHIYNNYYIHPMVGNPEFMSPEVISGTPVGLQTDIWLVQD